MDDDGSLGMRNWGYFEPPTRNLGLQLMSSVPADRDTKQLLSNGPFPASTRSPAQAPSMAMNFGRNEMWIHPAHHPREPKIHHTLTVGHGGQIAHAAHHEPVGYGIIPVINEPPPPKKRYQGRQPKVPRPKKPKKAAAHVRMEHPLHQHHAEGSEEEHWDGRKMSHGAFKKVLEKLAGEGYNLNNPIDLKTFWAKHGTNKFVTIR
ncbi:hypothetical protein GUJ93_ZPchr0012g22061 [Zizania palustris]|uniref:GAGA-binding transcriptional activator n=1 Tax=Zizania palustris TaxID=103762 RepID=A0A8J6BZX1_ZIZPA|nr:hypothetical protein GUJ93_ZPchr0012g22061 [Zizania palustris]